MKVVILESIASNSYSYARGELVDLSTNDANRLLNAGLAVRALDLSGLVSGIESAAESAGLTEMAHPSGSIPNGGGYYVSADGGSYIVCNPSGQRRVRFDTMVPSPAGGNGEVRRDSRLHHQVPTW